MSAMRATGMKSRDAVAPLRQRGSGTALSGVPVIRQRAERIVEAAAGQADLAEHRGQHDAHPDRLLAMLGALQRMREGDQHAPAGQRGAPAR